MKIYVLMLLISTILGCTYWVKVDSHVEIRRP